MAMMLMWTAMQTKIVGYAFMQMNVALFLILIPGLMSTDKATKAVTLTIYLLTVIIMAWKAAATAGTAAAVVFAISMGALAIAIAAFSGQAEQTFGGSPGGQIERNYKNALRLTKQFTRDYTNEMATIGLGISAVTPEIAPTTNVISGPIHVEIKNEDSKNTAKILVDKLLYELKLKGIRI
jgi:hypothetical protein